jgi:hypothetical protein
MTTDEKRNERLHKKCESKQKLIESCKRLQNIASQFRHYIVYRAMETTFVSRHPFAIEVRQFSKLGTTSQSLGTCAQRVLQYSVIEH